MRQAQQEKNKIKIAHIVFSLNVGGLEKLVVELAKRIDKDKFSTSVWCLTGEGTLSKELSAIGIKVFYFNKKGGVDIRLPFRIARALKKEKIGIVHTHDSSANLYGSVAAKIAGTKVIVNTEHGGIYFETRRKRLANRILCLLNDREICVSNNVKDDLRRMGLYNKKLVVIHNGIDFDRFNVSIGKSGIRKDFGLNSSDFIITTAGRLSGEKNQRLILDAARPVLEKIPEARFIIAGDGPLRNELQEYAGKLKIADKVVFLGERSDIPRILKMSDCFALSSNYESFGLTILEAMASGIPVIATDVGGVKEIVRDGETGVLIQKEDAGLLAQAVIKIKNDPGCSGKIVTRAKEMVKNRYRIEKMVQDHEDLYLNCYEEEFSLVPGPRMMRVITFGLDDRALLDIDGHSKRWNSRMGRHVGHLDVIVEVKYKTGLEEKRIAGNVRILPIYVPHPALYPFIAYKRALAEHRKRPYDLATTEEPFRAGLAGWFFKRKTGTALSVEYHNDAFYNREWMRERPTRHRLYTLIGKAAIREADSIRCVNKKNFSDIRKLCKNDPEKLIEIIPVPTEFYENDKYDAGAAEVRKALLNGRDGLLMLFVGRLVSLKRVDELINAFCDIRKDHKRAHLAIVGDGPDAGRLNKLAAGSASGSVTFTGYVPENEIFKYYGAADIFINPAHNETYGRIYIEAMSAGKPVITTNGVGAVEDKLCVDNVTSLVVEPGNLGQLKDAMVRLIEDEALRKRLGENGLKTVREKFDYEKALIEMRDFWGRTIRTRR